MPESVGNGWVPWSKHVLITIEQLIRGREQDRERRAREMACLRSEYAEDKAELVGQINALALALNNLQNDLKWKTGVWGTVLQFLPAAGALIFVIWTIVTK